MYKLDDYSNDFGVEIKYTDKKIFKKKSCGQMNTFHPPISILKMYNIKII